MACRQTGGGSFDRLRTSCDVLKLRPGITGPATLKYRLEDELIADFVSRAREAANSNLNSNLGFALPENVEEMKDQELAVWYNDNVIYPDKVRLNCYYYRHYSFVKDGSTSSPQALR